ncbi:MAG TPA: TAXI family TRAP transporter solute-binding subunit [Stellaceae bacterium]|nr:TAXI family TRAP transporter solute-binding subunit [Stellaceae bacterium]
MPTRIGTAETGGTFFTQALALKSVLDADGALAPVEVRETPGASVGNAELLDAGAIDFGFMAANWVARATGGKPPFARPIALRTIAPMNVGPLFFIVRADSALASVDDLAARRVVFGPQKSGMAEHAGVILGALGIAGAVPVHLDFAAGAAAVESGAADAQLQCPIPNRVMTELCRRTAVRVLPYGPGRLERVLAAVPFYRRCVMPAGAIPGLALDLPQIGVLNVLVAHARLGDDRAAAMARAIVAHAAALERLNPLFGGLGRLCATFGADGVPGLHSGAARAYGAPGPAL